MYLLNLQETLHNLLLKEYHEQYRIPFKEYGEGHAFIDEFIDWIQYSSQKGILPKPSITWEEGLKKGYDEYTQKGKIVWQGFDALHKFIKGWEDNGFVEFDKNGNLYVERSITMPVTDGDIDSEDSTLYQNQIDKYEKNVGGCWAVGRGTSAAYCGDRNNTTIILKGYMFLDDIYWEDCVRLWMRPKTEFEVRTRPNGRVMLTEIQVGNKTLGVKSFDGPRILKSTFFGNNETFHGDFAKLGFEASDYDKSFIDRQGKEYTKEEYINNIFPQLLKSGKKLGEITEFCGEEKEGFIRFCIGGKWNYLSQDGDILYSPNNMDNWFDECEDFNEGLAAVFIGDIRRGGKCNFINTKGTIQFPNLDVVYCESFHSGYAVVGNKSDIPGYLKYNILNKNGNIMFKEWFSSKFDEDNETILAGQGMAVSFDHNNGKLTPVGKTEYNSSSSQTNETKLKHLIRNMVAEQIEKYYPL